MISRTLKQHIWKFAFQLDADTDLSVLNTLKKVGNIKA